jgi:hypothetical protein
MDDGQRDVLLREDEPVHVTGPPDFYPEPFYPEE